MALELDTSIKYVKGVGPKLSQVLAKRGIRTCRDALFNFPRNYEDRRDLRAIRDLQKASFVCSFGRIRAAHPVSFTRSRRQIFQVILEDPEKKEETLALKWFRKPYHFAKFRIGHYVAVTGRLDYYRHQKQMVHPEVEFLGARFEAKQLKAGILPNYALTEGLYQKTMRKIEKTVVRECASQVPEILPKKTLEQYQWPERQVALKNLHEPPLSTDLKALQDGLTPAHERFIYEEFFLFALGLAFRRDEYRKLPGISFEKPGRLWDDLRKNLSFSFTSAQKRVLQEILQDMQSKDRMHRLVQGDVGSGKTVVAAAAAMIALESGYQVAFMAPTEVLIEQHYLNFKKWFEGTGIPVELWTGSTKKEERSRLAALLQEEKPLIALGTHALFEKDVTFSKLGLVIVDEQHRFGVQQRARLMAKGQAPDTLVMTATPIPRTLALTVYGDLDVSVIDELPPGRKPIETQVFLEKERARLEQAVEAELKKGRQAYFIFPLIEESEKLDLKSIEQSLPHLEARFRDFGVRFLHGRLSADEKDQILKDFKANEFSVLVSTTVVEVGVDCPNATVMVIENAERFGLSQLHQLRGRVGRGDHASFCYLVASHLGSEDITRRLRTLEKVQDGFRLSEVDLEIRGPGEVLGTRQAGLPSFYLAQLPRDYKILETARRDAFALVENSPQLADYPALQRLIESTLENWSRS